jgi:hypothetical protein
MELLQSALECAGTDVLPYIESDFACCALASGAIEAAEPPARRALTMAIGGRHPSIANLVIAYCAPAHALADPQQGARLFGFARARMRDMQFEGDEIEKVALKIALECIERALGNVDITPLLAEGAALTEDEAVALLAIPSTVGVVHPPRQRTGDDGVVALLS